MTQYPYMNPYLQSFYPYPQLQASQPTQQSPTSIIWVSGEREAAVYPVAPNNAVALWDSDAPVIYLKKADASGKPTMQAFDLVERKETKKEPESLEGIQASITEMKAEIESLKSDVYGIAGKKKKKGDDDE